LDGGRSGAEPATVLADVAVAAHLRQRRSSRRHEGQCGSGGEACLRAHLEMVILWQTPWAIALTMDIQR